MTDIERIELAIRRVLAASTSKSYAPETHKLFGALADELARMRAEEVKWGTAYWRDKIASGAP